MQNIVYVTVEETKDGFSIKTVNDQPLPETGMQQIGSYFRFTDKAQIRVYSKMRDIRRKDKPKLEQQLAAYLGLGKRII